ncbi:molybdenum cofactor synthesis protein [PVC group bacterium]|nr:molybdenum cofactor synthesis protein [PVC group bacterium]
MSRNESSPRVVSVNMSEKKGTIKKPVQVINFTETGVSGDAHAGRWHRQISILSQELIDDFIETSGRPTKPGEFAENITTCGLDLASVARLDRIRFGETEIEITQIGKECHGDSCEIFREVGKCVMPKEGLFARVVVPGSVRSGDALTHIPRELRLRVITLSDRAFNGDYEDRSGPAIVGILEKFLENTRWHYRIDTNLLPDEPGLLRSDIEEADKAGADIIITTGGTGLGPRDIAPDVVAEICDKQIPGIMENIRLKYGANKLGALLSRSIAGVKGKMQIYALPGSVRAVREYMEEILKTLEHVICTLHSIDSH